MQPNNIVSRDEWLAARKQLLAEEKQLTKMRDTVAEKRRALPWVKVEKDYEFDTLDGKKTLAELFGNNSQLIVYHFMWLWAKGQGCPSCSLIADHMDGPNLHLKHHDVTLVAVSRGKLDDITAYKKRLGWKFPLVSSYGSDFNFDFGVSFTEDQLKREIDYNFETIPGTDGFNELPGASVFYKDDAGQVFHTYSTYARGLDILLNVFNFLDLTPKGRNEEQGMDWVRRNDEYDDADGASRCH